jgi:hypothetical protein
MGGGGGTPSAGGAAGDNVAGVAGTAGALGVGGVGGSFAFSNNGEGGGGGGGLYGGGGGSTNRDSTHAFYNGGGGGGGGSNYVDASAYDVIHERGVGTSSGHGLIMIDYAEATTSDWAFIENRAVDNTIFLGADGPANTGGHTLRFGGGLFVAGVANLNGSYVFESADKFATTPITRMSDADTARGMGIAVQPNGDWWQIYSLWTGEWYTEVHIRRWDREAGAFDTHILGFVGKTAVYTYPFHAQLAYWNNKLRYLLTTGQTDPIQVRTGLLDFADVTLVSPADVSGTIPSSGTAQFVFDSDLTPAKVALRRKRIAPIPDPPLFSEDFVGTNGDPWDAGKWSTVYDSGAGATATIQGNAGRISVGGGGYTRMVQMAVGDYSNCTIRFSITPGSGSVEQYTGINFRADPNHTPQGQLEITDNGYFMGWESSHFLVLRKIVAGVSSNLTGEVDIGNAASLVKRWFKIVLAGSSIQVYTWLDGDTEPGSPTMSGTDATFSSGRISVYGVSGSDAGTRTFDFDDFLVTE